MKTFPLIFVIFSIAVFAFNGPINLPLGIYARVNYALERVSIIDYAQFANSHSEHSHENSNSSIKPHEQTLNNSNSSVKPKSFGKQQRKPEQIFMMTYGNKSATPTKCFLDFGKPCCTYETDFKCISFSRLSDPFTHPFREPLLKLDSKLRIQNGKFYSCPGPKNLHVITLIKEKNCVPIDLHLYFYDTTTGNPIAKDTRAYKYLSDLENLMNEFYKPPTPPPTSGFASTVFGLSSSQTRTRFQSMRLHEIWSERASTFNQWLDPSNKVI